jgi:hypothetical protein
MKRFIKLTGKGRNMVSCKFWGEKPNKWTKKENNKSVRQLLKRIEW